MACTLGTPFSITATVDGTVARVTVLGEIDPATVGTFSTILHTLAADGVEHFVIDATGLTFADSTAITALRSLLDAGEDTRVTLRSPSHRLLDLLLATGLDAAITITDTPA